MSFAVSFCEEWSKIAATRYTKEMRKKLGLRHNEQWVSAKFLGTGNDMKVIHEPAARRSWDFERNTDRKMVRQTIVDQLPNIQGRTLMDAPAGRRMVTARVTARVLDEMQRANTGAAGHLPRTGEVLLPRPLGARACLLPHSAPRLPWLFRGNPPTGTGVTHASRFPQYASQYAAGGLGQSPWLQTPRTGRLFAVPRRGFIEGQDGHAGFGLAGSVQTRVFPERTARGLADRQAAFKNYAMRTSTRPIAHSIHPHTEGAIPSSQLLKPVGEYKVRKVMAAGKPSYAVSHVSGLPLQTAFAPWIGGKP